MREVREEETVEESEGSKGGRDSSREGSKKGMLDFVCCIIYFHNTLATDNKTMHT